MELCYKFQSFFELLDEERSKQYRDIRYVILVGGRGGAKSHALSTWLNQASYNPGWGILSTRYTMSSAETSIIPEFRRICENMNNESDFEFKRTQVVNSVSGCPIDYKGLKPNSNNSTGALKSVSGKNIFVLEEAEDCPNFELFDKVDNSIRTIQHKNIVILCLNQGHVNHWIYKEFIKEYRSDTMVIETTYLDNLKYLDRSFIEKAERVKKRDLKRYNCIYLKEWKSDTDGALWLDSDISPHRITLDQLKAVDMRRIVIGYDPAVTDYEKPINERNHLNGNEPDEDGIVIAGISKDNKYYVMIDRSMRGTRSGISQKLVDLYHKRDVDVIVIEKNNGGDFIPALIQTADRGKYVRCKTVSATKGKKLRAQPIQAMYENGEVHHVGHFPELELEMTSWVPDMGLPSPNRIDALVWALSELSGNNGVIKQGSATGLY